VAELGQRYLAEGSLQATAVEAFRKAIASFVSMYTQRINIEDHLVFPLASRRLSRTDRAVIADEMAARREIKASPLNTWSCSQKP
jgi:hemerythrin-like domain-containing protein